MKTWPSSLVLFGLMIAFSAATPAGQNGLKDYVIQEAIDCAKPGDRIEVASGTYFENLVISKKISLIGIGDPVIDAGQNGSVMTILADGVVIEGFILRNSSIGSYPDEQGGIRVLSNNNIIRDNIITNNWDDVILLRSSGNFIHNNTLSDAEEGLDVIQSDNNTIFHNLFANDEDGIFVDNSYNNSIFSNQMMNCSDDGLILINKSQNNLARGNFVSGNRWHGIESFSSNNNIIINNAVEYSGVGNIFLFRSQHCIVYGNRVTQGDRCGIVLIRSDTNSISKNEVLQNNILGISLETSYRNNITFNSVIGNGLIGIDVSSSYDNTIYGNNLMQNSLYAAYDDGKNNWGRFDSPNRYSDFDENREGCFDKQYSGICDHGYLIPVNGNVDKYPMAMRSSGGC